MTVIRLKLVRGKGIQEEVKYSPVILENCGNYPVVKFINNFFYLQNEQNFSKSVCTVVLLGPIKRYHILARFSLVH